MVPQKIYRFLFLFSARIAGAASLFVVNLLIVRYLGLEALASYAVFVSLVSITAIIISSGFTAIAPILVAEYSEKKQPELVKGFVNLAVKHGSMCFAAIFALIAGLYLSDIKIPIVGNMEMGVAVLIAAGASAVLGFNGAVLVGMKKQVSGTVPETFARPVLFTVFTGLLLFTGHITQASTIMWLYALSVWLVFGLVLLRDRKIRGSFSAIEETSDTKRWRRAALPWTGISLLWDFMIDLMLLLASLLAGSVEIAILHICFRYRVLAGFGMRTIHTLLMPDITGHAVSGDQLATRRKISQVNLASLIYSSLVLLGFAAIGQQLLGLFSAEAVSGLPILLIVSATMLVRSIFGPAPLLLAIHNHHLVTLAVSLFTTLLAVVFVLLTYGNLGILAVAIGYTGANLIASVALWYMAKKKTGIDCSILAALDTSPLPAGSLKTAS
ncbi:MAG: hypothetical protein AAF423_01465 [Pseudomonadota bacterium]